MEKSGRKYNEIKILICIFVFIFFGTILVCSYAFFNYTRTGEAINTSAGVIYFSSNNGTAIELGNGFPLSASDIDSTIDKTISLTSHTTYAKGVKYRIYAVVGETVSGKTRLRDDVISLEFIPPADGNGFATEINNYRTPKSLTFVDGKALISTGIVKDTAQLTTKSYNIKLRIDSSKLNVSSTTKRANNLEGNPSLADTTTGTTTATRYMTNDSSESSLITLYPATEKQAGKIIYTTDEFSKSYYSIEILIEAFDADETELVYLDANGGTVSSNTLSVTPGQLYPTIPTPTRLGYTFLNWNREEILSKSYWEQGGMVDASGLVNTSIMQTRLRTKTYYKVSPSTRYIVESSDTDLTDPIVIRFVYFYDSNNSFIRTNGNICLSKVNFTTPSNCDRVRIVIQHRNGNNNISLNDLDNVDIKLTEVINSNVTINKTIDHTLVATWQ